MANENRLSKKDREKLWGENSPYSEVSLIEQTRLLDDTISRVFLVVEAKINPFTFELVLKYRDQFANDQAIQELLDYAEFRGPFDGYVVSAGEEELIDKKSFDLAFSYRTTAIENVLKMHDFVIKKFNLKSYKNRGIKISDGTSVGNKKYIWDPTIGSVAPADNSFWNSDSYVSSPAGEKRGKIRYFVVLALVSQKILRREKIKRSSSQTKQIATKLGVDIENAEAGMGYIMLTVLIGPDSAPADFIEHCISQSNKKKIIFKKEYLVTNISRPTGKEIEFFLCTLSNKVGE